MTILATATGPIHVSIRDQNGAEIGTHEELEAASLIWIEESNMLRLERELEGVRQIILFGYTIGTYPVFF